MVVLAAIIFSALMALRASHKEDVENQKFIEDEGQVYMERLENERRLRSDMNTG